jgi:DNA mismatch repair protein MutL
MSTAPDIAAIRILPDDVANKIAAGEVVERPASVVKELVENALDAGATRIVVRVVAAGRRLIEVIDNGHGMSEQNALLAVERHATSKIRKAADLEAIKTMGFRGEALASIASVSRFVLVTRRAKDESGTSVRIDGGILRDVAQTGAPPGTRVSVNRLYFNTPVRAKFLKGIATELGHCIDVVQRHALARAGVGFQFFHNDKVILDIPEHAGLRDRAALIWGLGFVKDMVEVSGERAGFKLHGVAGLPGLTRAQRSHQFFFINQRPVVSRPLQYGFEDGFRGLVTVGRHPVGVILIETPARFVDVNIHPTKREVRFRDDRVVSDAIREIVRECMAGLVSAPEPLRPAPDWPVTPVWTEPEALEDAENIGGNAPRVTPAVAPMPEPSTASGFTPEAPPATIEPPPPERPEPGPAASMQSEFPEMAARAAAAGMAPGAVYEAVGALGDCPMQIFDSYLLVPDEGRLLIIDQHALHERLNFDSLLRELEDESYESQQLAVPLLVEVPPSHAKLMESNLTLFSKLGLDIEPFGGNTFQVTAICHLYEESKVPDVLFQFLDDLAQGDLFDNKNYMDKLLRLATRACRESIKAGDPLSPMERRALLDGFRRLRPPYTCPHGRPIIIELTQRQMEKSFRRIQ